MQSPAIHIYHSISYKIFVGLFALIPGICVAILITIFPPAIFIFGFPAVLMIFLGLRIIWSCATNNSPAVVLDSMGLRIPGMATPILWPHISSVSGSTVIGRIPYRILNIHLIENMPPSHTKPNKFAAFIGKMVGVDSMFNIKLGNLAILESDLINLINEYKSNPKVICDDLIVRKTDSDLPLGYRVFNWGLVAFLLVFFYLFCR
jgi:hypothetical protein